MWELQVQSSNPWRWSDTTLLLSARVPASLTAAWQTLGYPAVRCCRMERVLILFSHGAFFFGLIFISNFPMNIPEQCSSSHPFILQEGNWSCVTSPAFHNVSVLQAGKNLSHHKTSVLSNCAKFHEWNTRCFPGENVPFCDMSLLDTFLRTDYLGFLFGADTC